MMRLVWRARREDGVAMILAIGVTFILFLLVVAFVALSLHSSSTSALDRKRDSALAAAEAGIDYFESAIASSTTAPAPCSASQTLTDSGSSSFTVTPTFYDASGAALSCTQIQAGVTPAGVLIHSTGSTGSSTRLRAMDSYVKLTSTGSTVFSNGAIASYGNGTTTLAGGTVVDTSASGANSDLYVAGNFATQGNGTQVHGSAYVQGTGDIQGTVYGSVWTNDDLTIRGNGSVGADAIAACGNTGQTNPCPDLSAAKLSNSGAVLGNARAGGAITGNGTVGGTKSPNSPQARPPSRSFSDVAVPPAGNPSCSTMATWLSTCWAGNGYVVLTYTNCAAAATDMGLIGVSPSLPVGKYVFRVTGCNLVVSSMISVRADLAIITDGTLTVSGNGQTGSGFSDPDTTDHSLLIFAGLGLTTGCTTNAVAASGNSAFGLATDPGVLSTFFYTPCSVSVSGQSFIRKGTVTAGGIVSVSGGSHLTTLSGDIPGYPEALTQSISYIREVAP